MLEASIKVYNFEVEDFHTYYVGDGVLVHNTCPNPGGRHGGSSHRAKVDSVKKDLRSKGWDVSMKESRISVGNGKYRYPDITAKKGYKVRFYQIGKATKSGKPIAREVRALQDLGKVLDVKTYFIPYNQ